MTLTARKIMGITYPQFNDMNTVEIFDESIRMKIPPGRPQTPEEIGQAVAFFASDEANEITGQTLNVDGGAVFN
jgi:NAD(P)-dependent dehydrogenase (short-subunit alcohol dehydrogenase family)